MSKNKKTILEPQECPSCGYSMSIHQSLIDPDDVPEPGNISLCAKCGAWNKYGPEMEILSLTTEEIADLDDQTMDLLIVATKKIKELNQRNMN